MQKVKTMLDEKGVFRITINRPEKYNAIDFDVINELHACITRIKADPQIKVVTITGSGEKAFCSGGDLKAFHKLRTADQAYEMLSRMGEFLYEFTILQKPTVAIVNGLALGGGCEILTACDFRLSSDHAQIGFVQANLGITTGWGGGALLLERVNKDKALSLLMKAEKINAKDAFQLGFMTELFSKEEFSPQTDEWVNKLSAKSAASLSAYKKMVLRKLDIERLRNQMKAEIKECSLLWESDEHHQAVDKFFQKRL